jgi:hypothetical protein
MVFKSISQKIGRDPPVVLHQAGDVREAEGEVDVGAECRRGNENSNRSVANQNEQVSSIYVGNQQINVVGAHSELSARNLAIHDSLERCEASALIIGEEEQKIALDC